MALSRGYCSTQIKIAFQQACSLSSINYQTWMARNRLAEKAVSPFYDSETTSNGKTYQHIDFFNKRRLRPAYSAFKTFALRNKILLRTITNVQHSRSDYAWFFTTKAQYSTYDRGLTSEHQHHHEAVQSAIASHSDVPQHQLNMDNCSTAEELLDLVDHQMKNSSLHNPDQMMTVVHQFQQLVFASLPSNRLSENSHFRRTQIEFTEPAFQILKEVMSDSRWKQFLSTIKEALGNDTIPLTDQARLLNCLGSLLFLPEESETMSILLDNCLDSIDLLTLEDLFLVSDICYQYEHHLVMKGKILAAIHDKMEHCRVDEINLSHLCYALENLQPVIGEETLQLLANVVKRSLTLDSSRVTPGVILTAYQLLTSHGLPYFQDLDLESINDTVAGEMSLELNDLPAMDLMFHSSDLPWPISNLLYRVKNFCRTEVCSSSKNVKKCSFRTLSYCLHCVEAGWLHRVIAEADALLLLQLLDHHTATGLTNKATILAYYNRLLELLPGLTTMLKDNRFSNFHKAFHRFFTLLSKVNIQPDDSLRKAVYKVAALDMSRISIDTPKPVLEIFFELAIDTLKSNSMLSFTDLSTLTSALSRLDTGDMLRLYQSLDEIFEKTQPDIKVKNQIQKLKASLQELFVDRLSRSVDLPTSVIEVVTNNQLSTASQPGLFEHVLTELPRFVFTGVRSERNRLGALAVLSFSSKSCPVYHEDLLEELTGFVARERPHSSTPAVQLLRALAAAGYTPQDFDLLTEWLWPLVSRILKRETMDKSFLIQVAFNMSVLGLFHDDLLSNIFSLPFLSDLHSELRDKPDPVRINVHQCLGWLSRSAAIECPHLPVPYLNQSNEKLRKTSRIDFLHQQKMLASLRRICSEDELNIHLVAPSQSPYCHHIDAEILFNLNFTPTTSSDVKQRASIDSLCQRVAILYVSQQDFCVGSKKEVLRGLNQAVIRQLQMLGYVVVTLSQNELSSMEIHNQQAQDDLVREKINSALGFQVFILP